MNNSTAQTPNHFVRLLSILHMALLAGVVFATIIFYYQAQKLTTPTVTGTEVLTYIFPLLGMAGIFIGKYLFSQKMQQLAQEPSLQKRCTAYFAAALVQYTLVEAPAFINLLWFGLTGNMLFFAVGLSLAAYLLLLRPTKAKIALQLNLNGALRNQFNKGDQPMA